MPNHSEDLSLIQKRLVDLELRLKNFLIENQECVQLAKCLQKQLIPERFPEIPGFKVLGRYIPGFDLSSEGFDLFLDKDKRNLWIVSYWTGSYGLSSVLLQSLIHMQTKINADKDAAQVFTQIRQALKETAPDKACSFSVCKVDLFTLKMEIHWKGRQAWMLCDHAQGLDQTQLLDPSLLEDKANARGEWVLKPGQKLFYLSHHWNSKAENFSDFSKPLQLHELTDNNHDFKDDINHLLKSAEKHLKENQEQSDICALAISVDPRKIHVA